MKTNKKNINFKSLFVTISGIVLMIFVISGCRKLIDIGPPASRISADGAFLTNSSASAVVSGIYSTLIANGGISGSNTGLSFREGLAADELTNYIPTYVDGSQFYQNALSASTAGKSNNYFWTEIYQEIYMANAVIDGVSNSTGITPAMKKQLDGEAKFIRAFYNFYAVNIYGDIPLVTTTDYLTNNVIKRSSKDLVYAQIIKDLTDAQSELSDGYVDQAGNATTERIRPNKGAATALLARVYLYTNNWSKAKDAADLLINASNYSLLTDLTQVFKKNTKEGIWELPQVTPGVTTWDATYFILTGAPNNGTPVAISTSLINSFEPNDKRFVNWVGKITAGGTTYYYPFKYQVNYGATTLTEYQVFFRIAEQYLIRAEAKAQLNDLPGAKADLNAIRSRAGLPPTTANDQASLLTAILKERRIELFTEWGHRWFDMIRTNTISSVMGSPGDVTQSKGGVWNSNAILAPLPFAELQANPNLTQNPGY